MNIDWMRGHAAIKNLQSLCMSNPPFTDDDKGRPECGVCVVCGPDVNHVIIQFGRVIVIPMLAGSMLLMFGAAFAVFFGCLGNWVLLLLFFRREN